MSLVNVPNGFDEIVKAYGDPRNFVGDDGWMSPAEAAAWEAHLGLVCVKLPEPLIIASAHPGQVANRIRCHPAVADMFDHALQAIYREQLWVYLGRYGGCFTIRTQRGNATRWSTHAWGIAGDFDVDNNPLGEPPRMNLGVVQIFEACGFVWGGRFRRPDGMHVQAAKGY